MSARAWPAALAIFGAVTCATATPALAHAPMVGLDGFLGGLLHPFFVPAHLLALLALGLLIGGQAGGRAQLLTMFTFGLVAGLVAIALAAGPSSANEVLIVAAALAGLWGAAALPLPPLAGWPLAAVTGAAIGLDSPPEVVSIATANLMLVGTGLGAVVVVCALCIALPRLTRDWQRIGVRIAGSWTAAAAILVLALRLVR
jgi:urease accessory protein